MDQGQQNSAPAYGVPFMNTVPQNLVNPSYGSQIYNPNVGARLGSGVNPFYGPNGTLSGKFGQFIQPGFPASGPGQTGMPNPFPTITPAGGMAPNALTQASPQAAPPQAPPPPRLSTGSMAGNANPGMFTWANTPYFGYNPGPAPVGHSSMGPGR